MATRRPFVGVSTHYDLLGRSLRSRRRATNVPSSAAFNNLVAWARRTPGTWTFREEKFPPGEFFRSMTWVSEPRKVKSETWCLDFLFEMGFWSFHFWYLGKNWGRRTQFDYDSDFFMFLNRLKAFESTTCCVVIFDSEICWIPASSWLIDIGGGGTWKRHKYSRETKNRRPKIVGRSGYGIAAIQMTTFVLNFLRLGKVHADTTRRILWKTDVWMKRLHEGFSMQIGNKDKYKKYIYIYNI